MDKNVYAVAGRRWERFAIVGRRAIYKVFASAKMCPELFQTVQNFCFSGVFIFSIKMAIFYGLYSYFIHTLFMLNVVFVPSSKLFGVFCESLKICQKISSFF